MYSCEHTGKYLERGNGQSKNEEKEITWVDLDLLDDSRASGGKGRMSIASRMNLWKWNLRLETIQRILLLGVLATRAARIRCQSLSRLLFYRESIHSNLLRPRV